MNWIRLQRLGSGSSEPGVPEKGFNTVGGFRQAKDKDHWFDLFKKRAIGDDDDP